jgi:nucleoside-diphosphate-sugar epimerase
VAAAEISRVSVTGGSGRLGRSVVTGLIERGYDVVSLDRDVCPGLKAPQIRVDLRDTEAVGAALAGSRPDAVIHLAAIAVPFSAPEQVILGTNTVMAYNVVSAAVESGARAVLAASSPTLIGYGAPTGWRPDYLPIDEQHPVRPWNAYAVSKQVIEAIIAMAVARDGARTRFGAFRPCFVISPEEWQGAPTQQGHTVADRLAAPELAAVSLFNYVDARDVADFVHAWLSRGDDLPNGEVFFVGARDALAREPLSDLVPRLTGLPSDLAAPLTGTAPAFSCAKAERLLGWSAQRTWRAELAAPA